MHDGVGAGKRTRERVGLADVALLVLHLRPALAGRVKRAPGDADHALDARVGLQQGHQAVTERPRGTGDGDDKRVLGGGHAAILTVGRPSGGTDADRPGAIEAAAAMLGR